MPFCLQQLKFLGHIITREGVEVGAAKTDSIRQYPTPTTQKQVRIFLGMANYYRKFIEGFSKIVAQLNALLAKNTKFIWNQECQTSFKTLKQALITAPVPSYPDPSKTFILSCDASDTAVG